MRKKTILAVMGTICALTLAWVGGGAGMKQVEAAGNGTTVATAKDIVFGDEYDCVWTYQTRENKCYNKVVLPERGVLTFQATQPVDYEGEVGDLDMYLYNSKGVKIWECPTKYYADKSIMGGNYIYEIGLDAGTYYFDVEAGFYVPRTSAPISITYSFSYEKNLYCETEPNNQKSQANELQLNQTYGANYGEYMRDGNREDWFKFSAKAGEEYTITITNAEELFRDTCLLDIYQADGTKEYVNKKLTNGNGDLVYTMTATGAGNCYIRIWNDFGPVVSYKIKVGSSNTNYTGLQVGQDGNMHYYKNGILDYSFNGLAVYGNDWYYVQNGSVNDKVTGLCNYGGSWWYVQNGKVNFGATGLCQYGGSWWYVQNGKVNFGATGLCQYGGSWWFVQNGAVNFKATGLWNQFGNWWYVENGAVNFKATGLWNQFGSWWFVQNGAVNFKATGLWNQFGSWWFVENGAVNFNYNGQVPYGNAYYNVVNGRVVF